MSLTLSEEFLSFQGEGSYMGRRAYFVRLHGCPLKCSWCDTKDSWLGKSHVAQEDEIVGRVYESQAEIAVITGGEPCLQNLDELVAQLKAKYIQVHLETSGVLENKWEFDWVVLSPKLGKPVHKSFLESADELKFIVEDIVQMAEYENIANKALNAKSIWLHPQSQKLEDKELLTAISDYIIAKGGIYRAGCQLHKIYNSR